MKTKKKTPAKKAPKRELPLKKEIRIAITGPMSVEAAERLVTKLAAVLENPRATMKDVARLAFEEKCVARPHYQEDFGFALCFEPVPKGKR